MPEQKKSKRKSVYAARFPSGERFYYPTWKECEKAIKGVSNVSFKGFYSREEADDWLEKIPGKPLEEIESTRTAIYVDGSFMPPSPYAGWAWAAIKGSNLIAEEFGRTRQPALSRNIDGELEATWRALAWAAQNELAVTVYHDYAGISHWALGTWKAKSEIAKRYQEKVSPLVRKTQFAKVKGHSGDKWNDHVDGRAKQALREDSPTDP